MQSKQELDDWYATADPWGYESNPDDLERKKRIIQVLKPHTYNRALDIGCGEGWITKHLPATEIHGLELSKKARDRIPFPVIGITNPVGMYDLVIATGVLYKQYDWRQMLDWIQEHSNGTILISGIKDWLVDLSELGEPVSVEEFKYREFVQEMRLYEW